MKKILLLLPIIICFACSPNPDKNLAIVKKAYPGFKLYGNSDCEVFFALDTIGGKLFMITMKLEQRSSEISRVSYIYRMDTLQKDKAIAEKDKN